MVLLFRQWQAAFLTSTSRLVLPINELRVYADAVDNNVELVGPFRFPTPKNDVVESISQVRRSVWWRGRELGMGRSGIHVYPSIHSLS